MDGRPAETGSIRLAANISLLFAELPYLDRPAAAAAAGFAAVETWWPFGARPDPPAHEVDEFIGVVEAADVQLIGLNLFAGDMTAGERGIISLPDRRAELDTSMTVVLRIAEATGCRLFNALYGVRDARFEPDQQTQAAIENLRYAADLVAPLGGALLIEALSVGENGAYPLTSPADVLAVIEACERPNVAALVDFYHFARNGFGFEAVLDALVATMGHVQVADAPGRHEPGTGDIDFRAIFRALQRRAYGGWVAAEYRPLGSTVDGLHWIFDSGAALRT